MTDEAGGGNDRRFDSAPGHVGPMAAADFDDFYRSNYRAVVAFAYSLCRNWSVAEEVTQEAFVAAHRDWRNIGSYGLPVGWVRRVAANHCASHVRRRIAETKANARSLNGRRKHSEAPEPPDDALWTAVSDLPSRQAEIIALHYVGGHPLHEISELLGLAPTTVRVHMHRARSALAARLDLDPEQD